MHPKRRKTFTRKKQFLTLLTLGLFLLPHQTLAKDNIPQSPCIEDSKDTESLYNCLKRRYSKLPADEEIFWSRCLSEEEKLNIDDKINCAEATLVEFDGEMNNVYGFLLKAFAKHKDSLSWLTRQQKDWIAKRDFASNSLLGSTLFEDHKERYYHALSFLKNETLNQLNLLTEEKNSFQGDD